MADRDIFDAIAETARLKVQALLVDTAETEPLCHKVDGPTAFIALSSGASAAIAAITHAMVLAEGVDGDAIIDAMKEQLADHWRQANSERVQGMVQ